MSNGRWKESRVTNYQCTNCGEVNAQDNCCSIPDPQPVVPQRCRRDDIDRVNICTCEGCEMYRDQNYKLRVKRLENVWGDEPPPRGNRLFDLDT